MKTVTYLQAVSALLLTLPALAQDTQVELSNVLDRDSVTLEAEATGDPLDEEAGWVDALTLPDGFTDGEPFQAEGENVSFLFNGMQGAANDSVRVDGQTLSVAPGNYGELELALLSVDDWIDLSKQLTLNYADGSSETVRFTPLSDWFDSPIRFSDQLTEFVDTSDVEFFFDVVPNQNDEDYIVENIGSGNQERPNFRFVDANGSLIYEFILPEEVENATLAVDMGNNFVLEVSDDIGLSWTQVLNSMEIFGEEIRNLSNRDVFEVDLSPFLAEIPDNIVWIRFTDATPENGWGPSIFNISILQGQAREFELNALTEFDASNGVIHADFRTDGGEEEAQYIRQNQGTQLSGVNHRFADRTAFIVYQFDLPNDLTNAAAWVNMEANFEVSSTNAFAKQTHVEFVPGEDRDVDYIVENTAQDAGNFRFADAQSRLMYGFDLPDDITEAELSIDMQNNFVASVGPSEANLTEVLNSQEMFGEDIRDGSNRDVFVVELAPFLENNDSNEVFLLFEDGSKADGWGPAVFSVSVTSGEDPEFAVLRTTEQDVADSVFGFNGTNTTNKRYQHFDLTPLLTNNPENTVFLKFSDPTTEDGWGPGLFRVVVFSGTVTPKTNRLVMSGLQPTGTVPDDAFPWGVNLLRKAFPVDASRQLESITLPEAPDDQDVRLFAVTLQSGETPVRDWSLF